MATVSLPLTPPLLSLAAMSDSGLPGDNLTKATTATINVAAQSGLIVTLGGQSRTAVNGTASFAVQLQPGSNTVSATVRDLAGNISDPGTLVVVRDGSPPATPVLSLDPASDSGTRGDNRTNAASATLLVAAENGSTVSLGNQSQVASAGRASFQVTLAEGSNTFTATATDAAGNVSSSGTLVVLRDATPPPAPLLSLAPASDTGLKGDNITRNATATIVVAAQNASTVSLGGQSKAVVNGKASFQVTLSEGLNILSAIASDTAGNASPAGTLEVFRDVTPPAVPVLTLDPASDSGLQGDNRTNAASVTILVSAEEGSTVSLGGQTRKVGGGGSVAFTVALKRGTNTLSATATDAAGLVSGAGSLVVVRDGSPPATPVLSLDPASDSGTRGDNRTNAASATLLVAAENGSTVSLGNQSQVASAGRASFQVTLAEGSNTFTATATDAAGNVSSSGTLVVLRDATPPPAPLLSLAPGSGGSTALVVSAENGSTVRLNDGRSQVVANGTARFPVVLLQGGNTFSATSTDAAGNQSAAGILVVGVDGNAPLPPVLNLAPASDTGVAGDNLTRLRTVTVQVNAESGSTVSLAGQSQVAIGGSASFQVVLTPGSNVLVATARDQAGNVSAQGSLVVEVDEDPPAAPLVSLDPAFDSGEANDDGITNKGRVSISVTAEAGTTVSLGGQTKESTGSPLTFQVDLTSEGNNSFTATAEDKAGNTGSGSLVVVRDTEKPAAPSLSLDPNFDTGSRNDDKITKEASVQVLVRAEAGSTVTLGTDQQKAGADGSAVFTVNLSDGTNTLSATATDVAGNQSDAGSLELTLDANRPAKPVLDLAKASDSGEKDDDDITNKTSVTIEVEAEPDSTVTLGTDEKTVGASGKVVFTVALQEGKNTLSSKTKDVAGNESEAGTLEITLDTEQPNAPTLTLDPASDSGTKGDKLTNKASVTVEVAAEKDATVKLGTQSAQAGADGKARFTVNLTEGTNNLSAKVTDGAGNESDAGTLALKLDTQKPDAPVLTLDPSSDSDPKGDNITKVATATIVVTAESDSTIKLAGQSQKVVAGRAIFQVPLTVGVNNLSATATDEAGNESTAGSLVVTREEQAVAGGVTDAEYALMTGYAHRFARNNQNNLPSLEAMGFEVYAQLSYRGTSNGFEGFTLKRGNDIVVAFAGTDEDVDFVQDFNQYFGKVDQIAGATELYINTLLQIEIDKAKDPSFNPNITFTGHSLGGGLASVMGILFDHPAIAFDSAPFRFITFSPDSVDSIVAYAEAYIQGKGSGLTLPKLTEYASELHGMLIRENLNLEVLPTQAELQGLLGTPESWGAIFSLIPKFFNSGIILSGGIPANWMTAAGLVASNPDLATRFENVRGYNKPGEFLSLDPFVPMRINREKMVGIDMGHVGGPWWFGDYWRDENTGFASWDLHTGTLWNAYFADARITGIARRLWQFIPEVFNSKVEEKGYDDPKTSFLEHVTYAPVSVGGVTTWGHLLAPFLSEIDKIKTDVPYTEQEVPENYIPGELTVTNPKTGSVENLNKEFEKNALPIIQGLIQLAINYYRTFDRLASDFPTLLSAGRGSITINKTRLVDRLAPAESEGYNSLKAYVAYRIKTEIQDFGSEEITISLFENAGSWALATRTPAVVEITGSDPANGFLLGSYGRDIMKGADGDDVFLADEGDDKVDARGKGKDLVYGGAGDDILYADSEDHVYGGSGVDRYIVTGKTEIQDFDGEGSVEFDGKKLSRGYKDGTSVYYTDNGQGIKYLWLGDRLEVIRNGSDEHLIIKKWKNGDLGITLTDDEADPNKPPKTKQVPARTDPLVLDLDGDGIETIGPDDPANTVYFDQKGNGVSLRTGWVLPDDGFLALDRNGNGRIDSGQELFGDSTPLSFGGTAIDGFDALNQEDTNRDGWVDARDARFGDLRIWRDLNQNGVSEANELASLSELGIAALRVTNTGNRQALANGNQVADLGTFLYADGRSGSSAVVGSTADIDLGVDLSNQQLPPVPIDPSVADLPTLQGSGRVRDLHSAASLSSELATQLAAFGSLDRAGQQNAIDALLHAWARSSDMTPLRERGAAQGFAVVYDQFERPGHYYYARPGDRPYQSWQEGSSVFTGQQGWVRGAFDPITWEAYVDYFESRLFVIEAMSGDYFHVLPGEVWPTASLEGSLRLDASSVTPTVHIVWRASHLGHALQGRYEALRQQVYEELVAQTRLASVLAPLQGESVDQAGAFSQIESSLRSRAAIDPITAIGDLIDLNAFIARRYGIDRRWHGAELLADLVAAADRTPELIDLLLSSSVYTSDAGEPRLYAGYSAGGYTLLPTDNRRALVGQSADDSFVGTGSADNLSGQDGNDLLLGRGGNDVLRGDGGDDVLEGGSGDDLLLGGAGNDLYRFSRGDGSDTIGDGEGSNTLLLGPGISAADLDFERDGTALIVRLSHGADQIRVAGAFGADGSLQAGLDAIEFADGSLLDSLAIAERLTAGDGRSEAISGTPGDDVIDAGLGDDTVLGLAGEDQINGGEGRDVLDGGSGDDTLAGGDEGDQLRGGLGYDSLLGGGGHDSLDGGAGDDLLAGGAGRDTLTGGAGYDTYRFELGDGIDVITDAGSSGFEESLQFGAGILAADLRAARDGDALVLQVGASDDRLVLQGWFAADAVPLARFRFADGTELTADQVRARLSAPFTPASTRVTGTPDDDERLEGGPDGDLLGGGLGRDTLLGGEGDDTLIGGPGRDLLEGGAGSDLYDFARGDGSDTISNGDGSVTVDRLRFGAGIAPEAVIVRREGDDLLLLVAAAGQPGTAESSGDQLRVLAHFASGGGGLDGVLFSGGESWDTAELLRRTQLATPGHDRLQLASTADTVEGGAGSDTIDGGAGDDRLSGGSSADNLSGDQGDDTLIGGSEADRLDGGTEDDRLEGGDDDDTLIGGTGNDTLLGQAGNDDLQGGEGDDSVLSGGGSDRVTLGAGADTLVVDLRDQWLRLDASDPDQRETDVLRFGPGIASAAVRIDRSGNDLVLSVTRGPVVTVLDHFRGSGDSASTLERIAFSDEPGTVWTAADVRAAILTATSGNDNLHGFDPGERIDGLAGNDFIDGHGGDDTLIGNGGNDQLTGGDGADSYLFSGSWGQDLIDNGDSVAGRDRILFAADVDPADVVVRRSGDDLLLLRGPDSLRVMGHFRAEASTAAAISSVAFGDAAGTVWDLATLRQRALLGTPGADAITGHAGDDTIEAGGGNDRLRAGPGNDTYRFGPGFGSDRIENEDPAAGRIDTILFAAGITPAQVRASRRGNTLYLSVGSDSLQVDNFFLDGAEGFWRIDRVAFEAEPGTVWSYPEIVARSAGATAAADVLTGTQEAEALAGLAGDDTLLGLAGNDTLAGDADNDQLQGGSGDDTLLGGDGHDLLYGEAGADRLDGGPGDDVLDGGAGRDTIVFGPGSGNDTIYPASESDVVDMGSLNRAQVQVRRSGNDLQLIITASSETLTVLGQFSAAPRVDELRFADAVLDAAAIAAALRSASGGDDALFGGPGADELDGLGGNDSIDGQGGNDTLRGGPGNDLLTGGSGDDSFRFLAGDGNDLIDAYDTGAGKRDVIELGAGITPDAVAVSRLSGLGFDDLLLTLPGGDSLRVRNFFVGDGEGPAGVLQVRFADGSIWTPALLRARVLVGSAGVDDLRGFSGDDDLRGGGGDDTLAGGTGSDTYRYERGDGDDTINNGDDSPGRVDVLAFGAGISRGDLSLRRVVSNELGFRGTRLADDLLITISGGGSVRVHHFFSGDGLGGWQLDRITFADGSPALDTAAMLAAVRQGTPGDDILLGTAAADTLEGLAGNDTLDGAAGNDTYRFAPGWGQDLILQNDPSTTKVDTAIFVGITRAEVSFRRDATDLFVTLIATGDSLRVVNFFLVDDQNARQIDRFEFSDQTLTPSQIRELLFAPTGGNDLLYGTANSETIDALAGNDTVLAAGGNDLVLGQQGNDSLQGGDGADTLDGGIDNDTLIGGEGNDSFRFGNGRGADLAISSSNQPGLDRVLIDAGLTEAQITLLRTGNDVLLFAPDGSSLRLAGFLAPGQVGRLGSVEFAGGPVWNTEEILTRASQGSPGPDNFLGDDGDNVFSLLGGNDIAYGGKGNDSLDGGADQDDLFGQEGNDTLDGGVGDGASDDLSGGAGDDTYRFGAGDGDDEVRESLNEGNDRLLFRAGLTPADLSFSRVNGDDLQIRTAGGDRLLVKFWFSIQARVERFVFADGTTWLENDVLQRLGGGTEGDDLLTGTLGDDLINALGGRDSAFGRAGNDTIDGGPGGDVQLDGEEGNDLVRGGDDRDYVVGGAGNDTLFGDAGDDVLQAGQGNSVSPLAGNDSDVLDGGTGNDELRGYGFGANPQTGDTLYRFGSDWGLDTISETGTAGSTDTIEFYGGTTPADLVLRYGYSAQFDASRALTISDGTNRVTVFNQSAGPVNAIERIRFLAADGSVIDTWDAARIASEALLATGGNDAIGGTTANESLVGGGGNDTLVGLGGNDSFDGGTGDDLLVGTGGADIYVIRAGFGRDTIRDRFVSGQLANTLRFEGLASSAFRFNVLGNHLQVTDRTDPSNQLTVENFFGSAGAGQPFTLEFSDASWGYEQVAANLSSGTDGDDDIVGTSAADALDGLGGNDRLRGQSGNDTLHGNEGNDTLEGSTGADQLFGDAGDDQIYASGSTIPFVDNDNDTLDGGTGDDTLNGGGGADTFRVGADGGFDTIVISSLTQAFGSFFTDGPAHDDTLLLSGAAPADVTLVRYSYADVRVYVAGGQTVELDSQLYGTRYELGFITFDDGTVWNRAEIVARTLRATDLDDWIYGTGAAEAFDGGIGDDRIEGNTGLDTLRGGAGNDRLWSSYENTYSQEAAGLYGDDGNDTLGGGQLAEGGDGDDVILQAIDQRGGTGNDWLTGNDAATTYRFSLGDGSDTLQDDGFADSSPADRIVFGTGVARSDLRLRASGSDLLLSYSAADSIRILDALAGGNRGTVIERLEFADGSSVTMAELLADLGTATDDDDVLLGAEGDDSIDGLGGNDLIQGGFGDDTLMGGAGNDTLFGGDDSDLLTGGSGDDLLDGGASHDTYVYAPGDGSDSLVDDSNDTDRLELRGIEANGVQLTRSGEDLVVRLVGSVSDRILVRDWFLGNGIDEILFQNVQGDTFDVWDRTAIAANVVDDLGNGATEGDDLVNLGDASDGFDALGGNDTVYGNGGNDTLIGGDGTDQLDGGDDNDVLDGSGGGYDDLNGGAGNDILISLQGDGFFNGSNGADTYRIGSGDGFRFLIDPVANEPGDVVELTADIDPASIGIRADGNGIQLFSSTNISWGVTLWGLLDPDIGFSASGTDGPIETLRFLFDNTTRSAADLRASLPVGQWQTGDGSDNTLTGDTQRNSLWGLAGNDTITGGGDGDWIYSGAGDDDVAGNAGDDLLEDRSGGADTYRWQRGDGTDFLADTGDAGVGGPIDQIVLGAGITPADVSFSRNGNTLEVIVAPSNPGGSDGGGINIFSWYDDNNVGVIERLQFANGTILNATINGFL